VFKDIKTLKILHLEDFAIDAELIDRELKKAGLKFKTLVVIDEKSFIRGLTDFSPDIILSDHTLPSFDSLAALRILRERQIAIPFILITAATTEEVAVNVMKAGAWDFIVKDRIQRLPSAVLQAMEKYNSQTAKNQADKELDITHRRLLFHIENSPFAYIEWDENFKIRSWSKRAEEIFGWTEKEVLHSGIDHIYANDQPWGLRMAEEILAGNSERSQEVHRNVSKKGKVIWCEWHNSVQKNEDGKVITIMSLVSDITARKKTEDDLRYSELRLREFFASAPMAMTVADSLTGNFVDFNQNAARLLGYRVEQLLKMSLVNISTPTQPDGRESGEKASELVAATMNGESPVLEWSCRHSNGEDLLCELRLSKLTGQGIKNELLATFINITARKQDEEILREINDRYESVSRATNDAIWDWKIPHDNRTWNHGIRTIFGYAESEINPTGMWWKSKIHPADSIRINQEIQDAFSNQTKNWTSNYQYLCADGTYRSVLDRAYIIYNNTEPIRMIGAMQDITEVVQYRLGLERMVGERTYDLKSVNMELQVSNKGLLAANEGLSMLNEQLMVAERQLKNTAEEIRDLYNNAPCGYLSLDHHGLIIDMNDTLLGWLGYQRDEIVKVFHIHRILTDLGASSFNENFVLFKEQGYINDIESHFLRKDGTAFPTMVNSSSVLDNEGKYIKSRTSVFDITKIKQIENELKISKSLAENANHTKSRFLANMSHEIRTPLNAVLGLSHLALKTDLTAKQSDYLKKIQSSSESLLSIINDILDFSKVESGKLKLEEVAFDLEEVFQKLADVIAYKAEIKGLEIAIGIDHNVPTYLVGDPVSLERILSNLCSNAVKFTEQGEVIIKVSLAETSGDFVKLKFHVSDTGIGMDELQLSKLFEPFTQADNSISRKYGGTGLGLSILKRLVELMDGEVSVISSPGEGSDFTFTVWLKIQEQQRQFTPPSIDLRELNVLVVEDNLSSLNIMKDMLQSFSFNVITVDSGLKAIHYLKNTANLRPVQLVLMDSKMPGMDGLEAAAIIRQDAQLTGVKIILMCKGSRHEIVFQKSEELRLSGILVKPIRYSTTYDLIINAIEKNTSIKQPRRQSGIQAGLIQKIHHGRVLVVEDNEINQQVASELLTGFGFMVDIAANGFEAVTKTKNSRNSERYDLILMDLQMPVMGGINATIEI
jgi:PAS domain S-box-containing protein